MHLEKLMFCDVLVVPLADKKMIPIENHGVKCMSMGSLVAEGDALVWRGPMASADYLSTGHVHDFCFNCLCFRWFDFCMKKGCSLKK